MDRLVLSGGQWGQIAPLIIGRPDQKGSTATVAVAYAILGDALCGYLDVREVKADT